MVYFRWEVPKNIREKLQAIESERPKKALSPYMIFVRETRAKVCRDNPDMHALKIMKEVGYLWKHISQEEKARFEEYAQKDKIRFQSETEAYNEKLGRIMNDLANKTNESKDEKWIKKSSSSPVAMKQKDVNLVSKNKSRIYAESKNKLNNTEGAMNNSNASK